MDEKQEYLVWIGIHHHLHGFDVFPIVGRSEPTPAEVVSEIEKAGGTYEPGKNEWIETRGPWIVKH